MLMERCAAAGSQGLIHGLMDSVDCHVRVLVSDSYADLVGPGTLFAAIFTGFLTIYVALIGYQLLLGRGGLLLSRLPIIGIKLGLIMALVTSWAAYQTAVFNLVFDGPRELTEALLGSLRRAYPDLNGDLYGGVEGVYAALAHAATAYGAQASVNANILQGGPMLGSGLLWLCSAGMLISTIGLVLASKIVLGFLLAIGPLFIAFFLFDPTRGLFDGWVRTTLTVAIAPLAANVFGVAMLIMLTPFVETLSAHVATGEFDMGTIMTISLIVIVFAGILFATVRLAAGLAGGFGAGRGLRTERIWVEPPASSEARTALQIDRAEAPSNFMNAPLAAAGPELQRVRVALDAPTPSMVPASERLGQRRRSRAVVTQGMRA
jgi:type IV secretion system protein VirB6